MASNTGAGETRSPTQEGGSEITTQGASESTTQSASESATNSRRGMNRARFNSRSEEKSQKQLPRRFTGKEESLGNEFVYQHTDGREASDQYSSTTDEIIQYSSTKYKNGADVGRKLIIPVPGVPTGSGDPPVVLNTDMMVWKMKVQLALQRSAALDSNLQSAYASSRDSAASRSWKRWKLSTATGLSTRKGIQLGC
jgi:hypothetical protein